MHCLPECYPCLEGLARRCASLATADLQLRGEALDAALAYLEEDFSLDRVSIGFAGEMQRIIRHICGSGDPFAQVKSDEMALARRCAVKYAPPAEASLQELVDFAAKGNGFDFFQDLKVVEKQLREQVEFARNDTPLLERLLQALCRSEGKSIVYLADNAGECFFDLPLVRCLEQRAAVYYTVKESPVQNDLTLSDLAGSGIGREFSHIVSTGTDSPGLDLACASPYFKGIMEKAHLILAKGMGHYETLTELVLPQPVFLIFQVKCKPVAQTAGLPRGSFAAYFL